MPIAYPSHHTVSPLSPRPCHSPDVAPPLTQPPHSSSLYTHSHAPHQSTHTFPTKLSTPFPPYTLHMSPLEEIGFGRFQWHVLLVCSLGYFGVCSELLLTVFLEDTQCSTLLYNNLVIFNMSSAQFAFSDFIHCPPPPTFSCPPPDSSAFACVHMCKQEQKCSYVCPVLGLTVHAKYMHHHSF